ncbi:VOC family protein [Belliella marina]|uniref:VOC family protein n=1 Tax=Belliella marina TaxID=1644146 RepID=A0ABW4VHF1_9BACT
MGVKRIVINIDTEDTSKAEKFYGDILGLEVLMDLGWIKTYGNENEKQVQISFANQGGSGTGTPDMSIEVEDVDTIYHQMKKSGFKIEYGPVIEPWGVYRFYVRDPFNKLVNILSHIK